MATGGDIIEITYSHPTIGSGVWFPKAGEDSTFDPGGFVSNDEENGIDGGGNMIDQMNRKRWSFEGTLSWDANIKNELITVKQLASSPVLADFTITSINGTVWSGKGKPVGDNKGNGNSATLPLKLAGGSDLKKII